MPSTEDDKHCEYSFIPKNTEGVKPGHAYRYVHLS